MNGCGSGSNGIKFLSGGANQRLRTYDRPVDTILASVAHRNKEIFFEFLRLGPFAQLF